MTQMRRIAFVFSVTLPLISSSQGHVPGQLLVQPLAGVDINRVVTQFNNEIVTTQITSARNISSVLNAWLVEFDSQAESDLEVLDLVRQNSLVNIAQFNHYVSTRRQPNDNNFGTQWNLGNIDAEDAWDVTTGGLTALGDTIVVAVVDGGIDQDHEDLQGNLWRNYADPHNGIDDDSNGFTDDHFGWDFFDDNDDIFPDWHGTPIASIIGAKGDNNIGIAGINWNVKLMAVEGPVNLGHPNIALAEAGVIESYSYILGFRKDYNLSNGAEGAFVVAVNSSWGVDQGDPDDAPLWCAMYDSMGAAGILNCAATANSDWDIDVIGDLPTACASDYLISVTNTNVFDQKVIPAGYGDTTIDLGAPGEDAQAAFPGNQYFGFGGTSGATPHVAGAVALIYSTTCTEFASFAKTNPADAALAVKQFIMDGVDQLTDLQGKTVSGGRLNLFQSLARAENYGACVFLGMEDEPSASIIGLSPNPASDFVKVQFKDISADALTMILADALGREVQTHSAQARYGNNSLYVDLSGVSPGIYFVYVSGATQQSERHKLVIH